MRFNFSNARRDGGMGRSLLTPRYCFLAQNAFYGLVAKLPRE